MDPFPDHVTAISTANSQDKRKTTATSVLALLRLIELANRIAETEDRTLILQMHQTETKADDSLIAINHLLSRLPCLA